jgi:hypothetical protein
MRDKNHPMKTVIVREDSKGYWQIIAKRGKMLIAETKPESNFSKVFEAARFDHCLFDDEPSQPTIERFNDDNFVEKRLTQLGEWCEKSFDKMLKIVTF